MVNSGFFSESNASFNQSKSKRFYFMAGLPRSGSTLLSSILNQNPSDPIPFNMEKSVFNWAIREIKNRSGVPVWENPLFKGAK
jgi:LPS sulfotransferase NodH